MSEKLPLYPKFRTTGTSRKNARVFLQCSLCSADIREIKPNDTVDVTVAHLCEKCDPGKRIVIHNTPNED